MILPPECDMPLKKASGILSYVRQCVGTKPKSQQAGFGSRIPESQSQPAWAGQVSDNLTCLEDWIPIFRALETNSASWVREGKHAIWRMSRWNLIKTSWEEVIKQVTVILVVWRLRWKGYCEFWGHLGLATWWYALSKQTNKQHTSIIWNWSQGLKIQFKMAGLYELSRFVSYPTPYLPYH